MRRRLKYGSLTWGDGIAGPEADSKGKEEYGFEEHGRGTDKRRIELLPD